MRTSSHSTESLLSATALEQARLIRERRVGVEELVELYLGRIERLNPRLAAFVSVFGTRARAEARRKDRRRPAGALPPFWGVPTGVKDLNMVRGSFAKMGSRAWRWLWTPIDDLTVTALRRAGFVLLGKLSTSELALMPVVETDLHAPTRNPWNDEHTAGGSSGGSGAAVAADLLPIAQGSDGAGSIRIPAALCGLVGMKVSRGRVPNPHHRVDRFAMSAIGPLARDVDDAAAMLDALRGVDPASSSSWLRAATTPPRPLRIRVVTDAPVGRTDPEVAAAVRRMAGQLADLGHHVEEGTPLRAEIGEFLPIYQQGAAGAPVLCERALQPVTRWLRDAGRRLPRGAARTAFGTLVDRTTRWYGDTEVLLTPTTPVPAPHVGAWRDLPPDQAFEQAAPLGAFTAAWNMTGQPAISLPAGLTSAGLPIGAQLVGRAGEDETILALARQVHASLAIRTSAAA